MEQVDWVLDEHGDRDIAAFFPGCGRCGCTNFFYGQPEPAGDAEKLAEDRYRFAPVFVSLIECVNCGFQDYLYETG